AEAYVVSDQGHWFLENDPRLRTTIGFDDPAVDAIGYAVRNMGFIKVAVRSPSVIRVTLHPRNAVQDTVKAVADFLAARGHGEFSLEHLSEEWRVETFSSGAAAAARLSELSGSPL